MGNFSPGYIGNEKTDTIIITFIFTSAVNVNTRQYMISNSRVGYNFISNVRKRELVYCNDLIVTVDM